MVSGSCPSAVEPMLVSEAVNDAANPSPRCSPQISGVALPNRVWSGADVMSIVDDRIAMSSVWFRNVVARNSARLKGLES